MADLKDLTPEELRDMKWFSGGYTNSQQFELRQRAVAQIERLQSRVCGTCIHDVQRQTRSMGMTFDTPWCSKWNTWRPSGVNGCTAHEPKEGK